MSYQRSLFSKQTKSKKGMGKPKPLHASPRDRASLWGNPARKFEVALRRMAIGIKNVLILLSKDHLQSIGSLLNTNTYSSTEDTRHLHVCTQW